MAAIKYPERLLQPFANLEHFQQELYAMLRGDSGKAPAKAKDQPKELEITDADDKEAVAFKYAYNAALRGKGADEAAAIGVSTSVPGIHMRDPNDTRAPVIGGVEPTSSRSPSPRGPAETRTVYDRRREATTRPSVSEPQRVSRPVAAPPPDDPRRTPKADDPKRPTPSPQAPATEERKASATATTQATTTPPQPKTPDPTRKYPDPPPAKEKAPVTRASSRKPVDDDSPWPFIEHPIPVPGDGGGASQPLVGRVTGAGEKQATVDLYESGPDETATTHGVTVLIPTLHADERMSIGDWIYGIYQFDAPDGSFGGTKTVYYAQVPVWVA